VLFKPSRKVEGWTWWHMPVTPAAGEAEAGGVHVQPKLVCIKEKIKSNGWVCSSGRVLA
jgi:hypothetical protein